MKTRLTRLFLGVFVFCFVVSAAVGGVAHADGGAPDAGASTDPGATTTLLSAAPTVPGAGAPTVPTVTAPEDTTVTTGSGTPSDPTVTTTTATDVDKDTGTTTTTTDTSKTWQGDGESGGNITGQETGHDTEKHDKDGKLIDAQGTATGEETDTKKTETGNGEGESVTIDNGKGTASDGKKIESEVPEITVDLQPGDTGDKSVTEKKTANTWFDDDSLDLPDWVRQKGEDGAVTWATDNRGEDGGTVTDITVTTGATDESGKTATSYVRTVTAPDGSTSTETVRCVRDAEGRIVGYDIETMRVETAPDAGTTPPDASSASGAQSATSAAKTITVTSVELPAKPTAAVTDYYDDGSVKNGEVVLELCDADGNVIGYTVVTKKDGVTVSCTEPVLGRYVVTTTVEEDLGNGLRKRTTTKTYSTRVDISAESGSVGAGERSLTGWMDEVTGSDTNGKLEGTFVPGKENNKTHTTDFENDLFNRKKTDIVGYDTGENVPRIQYLGEISLESAIRVSAYAKNDDGNGYHSITSGQAHIFILQDGPDTEEKKANRYYVYCCDYDTLAKHGVSYNVQRLEDADYYSHTNNEGKAKNQIRSIVLNGYWGVENKGGAENPTPGSLDAFKKMLVDNGAITAEQAASLTDGMALTATQAAIWYYGSSDHNQSLSTTDIVGVYCAGYDKNRNLITEGTENEDGKKIEVEAFNAKEKIVNLIYQYLINIDDKGLPGRKATADNSLMNAKDFAQNLKLTVGAKDANGDYDTTITFSMAEVSSATKNDLVVYIKNNDTTLYGYRLCGDGKDDAANNIKTATKNADGTYTLEHVYLPGGTNVNLKLNLSGTQIIENGALLFSCTQGYTAGQTFIGGGMYTKDIDYSVNFGFEVHDPAVLLASTAATTGMEKLEWSSEYHTYEPDDNGDSDTNITDDKPELPRNTDVPKTGDSLCAVELALALGALVSLAFAAAFIARAKKAES